jgi:hypothetical protein
MLAFLLREGQKITYYLRSIYEKNKVYIVASKWLNVCFIGLETFGEKLILDDIMADDETTQARI